MDDENQKETISSLASKLARQELGLIITKRLKKIALEEDFVKRNILAFRFLKELNELKVISTPIIPEDMAEVFKKYEKE